MKRGDKDLNQILSKLEVDILNQMFESGLLDSMNSRTIQNIGKRLGINYYRTRTNIIHLLKLEYIQLGFRERGSNTYFISKKGVEIIKC